MPTYEYKCDKCGYEFEEYQSIIAEPLKKCKKEGCGGAVHRLLSAGGGFLFKGSGFYITDHRSDSYKKSAQSDTGGASPSAPAKPASTPPSAPSSPGTGTKKESGNSSSSTSAAKKE